MIMIITRLTVWSTVREWVASHRTGEPQMAMNIIWEWIFWWSPSSSQQSLSYYITNNHHHHPKWRWCYKILLVWAQPLSPAGLPQTPFIKWWTSPHKQLAEKYENGLTTYQGLKMIWLQNRLRSNDWRWQKLRVSLNHSKSPSIWEVDWNESTSWESQLGTEENQGSPALTSK